MALGPRSISCLQCSIVGFAICPNAFRDDFLAWGQCAEFHADQIVAGCPRCPTVAFNKWMYPVHSPQHVCRQSHRIVDPVPILMNYRQAAVHKISDMVKMRWNVVANIDWLFPKPSTKLGNVRYCRSIQGPQGIFIKEFNAFIDPDFDAVCQQIVLPEQVLLLNFVEQFFVAVFPNGHTKKGPQSGPPS